MDVMHEKGNLTFYCHPQWSSTPARYFEKMKGNFAMEIWNSGCAMDNYMDTDAAYWDEILGQGICIYGVATDDELDSLIREFGEAGILSNSIYGYAGYNGLGTEYRSDIREAVYAQVENGGYIKFSDFIDAYDKAVLFDPSAPLVLLPMSGLLEFKTQKGKIVTKSFDEEYCYEEKISEHDFEKVNRINLRKLKSLEPLDVSEEMSGEYLEAFTTYIRYSDEISDFKDKEMPKIKRLSKLNKIVTPYFEKEKSSGE